MKILDCTTQPPRLPSASKRLDFVNRLSHLRNQLGDLQALAYKTDETERDGRVAIDIANMWADSAETAIRCMETALQGVRS